MDIFGRKAKKENELLKSKLEAFEREKKRQDEIKHNLLGNSDSSGKTSYSAARANEDEPVIFTDSSGKMSSVSCIIREKICR